MESTFNVLGIKVTVKEVPVVDKYKPAAGEYDPLSSIVGRKWRIV